MPEHTHPSPQELRELLAKLYIFDATERGRIEQVIAQVTNPEAMAIIRETLADAVAKQDEWTTKIAKSDLTFPAKMGKFLHERVAAMKAEAESADATRARSLEISFHSAT